MNIHPPHTAVSSRAKCLSCRAPIIKGEGVMRVSQYYSSRSNSYTGYFCYKCTKEQLERQLNMYAQMLQALDKATELTPEELSAQKMIRKL